MREVFAFVLMVGLQAMAQVSGPEGGGVRPGRMRDTWQSGGPRCMEVPDWQVHEYNPDFYILRESGCTNYEKPFLYLLFGSERALLLDTGAGDPDTATIVAATVHKWLQRTGRPSISLIVAHSHSHGDHKAGDRQLAALNDPKMPVTMVPLTVEGTARFYGIGKWPETTGSVDLGGRVIDVVPIPGHDTLSIALYDRQTGVLLSGDSLYPGRLYVPDFAAFVCSAHRLAAFVENKPVTHVLGCHIEQSRTPYLDYPIGSMYQPEEHALELSRAHLIELDRLLAGMKTPAKVAMPDYTVWPTDDRVWQELDAQRERVEAESRARMWGTN
jgi:hydroxyacylglutathione hydrolase